MTTLGTLQGTNYRKLDGSLDEGTLHITTNIAGGTLRDPAGNVIWSGSLEVPIVDGTFTITLPPTDDETLSADGFVYIVTERLKSKERNQWRVVTFPLPAGATVNMADLASGTVVPPSPGEEAVDLSTFLSLQAAFEDLPDEITADLVGTFVAVFKPEAFGAIGNGIADDTAAVNAATAAALAASAFAAGGGTVEFTQVYRCDGQLVFPTDGADSYPKMGTVKWRGVAPGYSNPVGGSGTAPAFQTRPGTLDLRYTGGGTNRAKIAAIGTGTLDIDDLNLYDGGTSTNPYLKTTNTRLLIRAGVSFMGNPSKHRNTCNQDAIVLGGNTPAPDGDSSDDEDGPFQGYGTQIIGAQFHRIRSAVKFGMYANGVVVRDLNVWASCGSSTDAVGAIQLAPEDHSASVFGNIIDVPLLELAGYKYGVVVDYAQGNTIRVNAYDPDEDRTAAAVYFASVNGKLNAVLPGYCRTAEHPYALEAIPGLNLILDPNDGGQSRFPGMTIYDAGIETRGRHNGGVGTPEITFGGSTFPPRLFTLLAENPNGVITGNEGAICLAQAGDEGRLWVKKADTIANTGWAPVGAVVKVVTKTADYALTGIDELVVMNGASLTATLPATASVVVGRRFTIRNIAGTDVTVNASGANVDGGTVAVASGTAKTFVRVGAAYLSV